MLHQYSSLAFGASAILSLSTSVYAQCSNFTAVGSTYTADAPSVPISNGFQCPQGSNCSAGDLNVNRPGYTNLYIPVGGIYDDMWSLNLSSIPSSSEDSLFDLINKAVPNFDADKSVTTNFSDGMEIYIQPGDAGYFEFVPSHSCVNGSFSGCSGSGYPMDGEPVMACSPLTVPGCMTEGTAEYPCLRGYLTFRNTTPEAAEAVNCTVCESRNQTMQSAAAGLRGSAPIEASAFAAILAVGIVMFAF